MHLKASTADWGRRGDGGIFGFLRNKDKPSEFFFKKRIQHLTIFAVGQKKSVHTFRTLKCHN